MSEEQVEGVTYSTIDPDQIVADYWRTTKYWHDCKAMEASMRLALDNLHNVKKHNEFLPIPITRYTTYVRGMHIAWGMGICEHCSKTIYLPWQYEYQIHKDQGQICFIIIPASEHKKKIPYDGPLCIKANIPYGYVYFDKKQADEDCKKLNENSDHAFRITCIREAEVEVPNL